MLRVECVDTADCHHCRRWQPDPVGRTTNPSIRDNIKAQGSRATPHLAVANAPGGVTMRRYVKALSGIFEIAAQNPPVEDQNFRDERKL